MTSATMESSGSTSGFHQPDCMCMWCVCVCAFEVADSKKGFNRWTSDNSIAS